MDGKTRGKMRAGVIVLPLHEKQVFDQRPYFVLISVLPTTNLLFFFSSSGLYPHSRFSVIHFCRLLLIVVLTL